jgi:hypothetical protein
MQRNPSLRGAPSTFEHYIAVINQDNIREFDRDSITMLMADQLASHYSDSGFPQRRQWRIMPMGGQHFFQRMSMGIVMSG